MRKKAATTETETGLTFTIKHDDSSRVSRGGGWDDSPAYARVASRSRFDPSYRVDSLGFRLVREGT